MVSRTPTTAEPYPALALTGWSDEAIVDALNQMLHEIYWLKEHEPTLSAREACSHWLGFARGLGLYDGAAPPAPPEPSS